MSDSNSPLLPPGGLLRYVNDAGLLIRGGDRQSIVNRVGIDQYVSTWELMDLDGRPLKPDAVPLAQAIRFGETGSRELIIRRTAGDDRIVLADAAPIRDHSGKDIAQCLAQGSLRFDWVHCRADGADRADGHIAGDTL
jgi:hypothetical protein